MFLVQLVRKANETSFLKPMKKVNIFTFLIGCFAYLKDTVQYTVKASLLRAA